MRGKKQERWGYWSREAGGIGDWGLRIGRRKERREKRIEKVLCEERNKTAGAAGAERQGGLGIRDWGLGEEKREERRE